MVYTEFVVEVDTRFGEYNACNPNSDTGIFECETWGSNNVPPQCAKGFEIFHDDCLNGTVIRSFPTPSNLAEAEAACCAACSKDGQQCGGWNMMPGTDSWTCQILANDKHLAEWSNAQSTVGCKAAQVDSSSYACWYANPQYNTSFAEVCDPRSCTCDAISNRSVGREQNAMCWQHSQMAKEKKAASQLQLGDVHSKWFNYVGELACILDGTWYSTLKKGQCKGGVVDDTCWWRLAETHRTVNSTCVNDHVVTAVRNKRPDCWTACPQPTNRSSACYLECLFGTMIGKSGGAMSKEEIAQPFVTAFQAEEDGGCPEVPTPTPPALTPNYHLNTATVVLV